MLTDDGQLDLSERHMWEKRLPRGATYAEGVQPVARKRLDLELSRQQVPAEPEPVAFNLLRSNADSTRKKTILRLGLDQQRQPELWWAGSLRPRWGGAYRPGYQPAVYGAVRLLDRCEATGRAAGSVCRSEAESRLVVAGLRCMAGQEERWRRSGPQFGDRRSAGPRGGARQPRQDAGNRMND